MIENTKEEQDIMSAEEIVTELQKLIDSERSEKEPGAEADAQLLEEALLSIRKFIDAEEAEISEVKPEETPMPMAKTGVVDTNVLTGPINGLKNFLIKKQRANEAL
jgi:hypothetical protein